ncbi:hypothetical protein GCM10023405_45100 [Streptomonospora salina]
MATASAANPNGAGLAMGRRPIRTAGVSERTAFSDSGSAGSADSDAAIGVSPSAVVLPLYVRDLLDQRCPS